MYKKHAEINTVGININLQKPFVCINVIYMYVCVYTCVNVMCVHYDAF